MRKVLVASHGYLANGIKSSMELLIGARDNVFFINAYVEDGDITKSIKKFMDSIEAGDEAVIFTDLYGGSVNQKVVMQLPLHKKIFLITGFNLPVVVELVLYSGELTEECVQEIIDASRVQLLQFSKKNDKVEGEEECEQFFACSKTT